MGGDLRRVVLYGDSLILAGVRACLEACPTLEVLLLDSSLDRPMEAIRALCPAVFIFDLVAVPPDFQLSLLQLPGLLLIGINAETHQALVWSGRQAAATGAADLLNMLRAHCARPDDPAPETGPAGPALGAGDGCHRPAIGLEPATSE